MTRLALGLLILVGGPRCGGDPADQEVEDCWDSSCPKGQWCFPPDSRPGHCATVEGRRFLISAEPWVENPIDDAGDSVGGAGLPDLVAILGMGSFVLGQTALDRDSLGAALPGGFRFGPVRGEATIAFDQSIVVGVVELDGQDLTSWSPRQDFADPGSRGIGFTVLGPEAVSLRDFQRGARETWPDLLDGKDYRTPIGITAIRFFERD